MGDKLSKNIVVVVLSLLSAVVGIVAFATGMDLPGLLDAVSPSAAQTASPAPSPPQTGGTEEPAGGYTLTAAALEQPDPSSGVYALTGTWKLQGTHEAAASFSQSVEVSPWMTRTRSCTAARRPTTRCGAPPTTGAPWRSPRSWMPWPGTTTPAGLTAPSGWTCPRRPSRRGATSAG